MIKRIFIISSILISLNIFAQKDVNKIYLGKFYADSSSIIKSNNYYNLNSILKSPNQIEIRLFIRHSWSGKRCIILQFKDEWKKTIYKYNSAEKKYVIESVSSGKELDTIFQKLVSKNIFAIKNDIKIKYKYFDIKTNKIEGIHHQITDGISYLIEFKVGQNYRSYYFENPEVYAGFETSNHDLHDFNSIVKIMESDKD